MDDDGSDRDVLRCSLFTLSPSHTCHTIRSDQVNILISTWPDCTICFSSFPHILRLACDATSADVGYFNCYVGYANCNVGYANCNVGYVNWAYQALMLLKEQHHAVAVFLLVSHRDQLVTLHDTGSKFRTQSELRQSLPT